MKKMKQVAILLLTIFLCIPLLGCEVDEDALKDAVQDAAEEYLGEKKEEAQNALNDAVNGMLGEMQDQITTEPEAPSGEGFSCNHTVPEIYIETKTKLETELTPKTGDEVFEGITQTIGEKKTAKEDRKLFDITICITCGCGSKNIENIDYTTFVELVTPTYSTWKWWHLFSGVSEYEYYSRKYAIYLGKFPSDLDLDVDTKECVIHYDPSGGFFPPEDQYFKPSPLGVRISEDVPIRPGFHFLGWTRALDESEVGKGVTWKPGEYCKFTQKVTLYACWEKHEVKPDGKSPYLPSITRTKHEYSVEDSRGIVSIRCSCGMIVNRRRITEEEFFYYAFNKETDYNDLGQRKGDMYRKKYQCYLARDVGPLALYLNGALYQPSEACTAESIKGLLEDIENISNGIARVNQTTASLAEFRLTSRADKEVAEDFFGKIGKIGKVGKAAAGSIIAIDVYQTGKAFSDMITPGSEPLDATINMLDVVEGVVSFTAAGPYLGEIFNILHEGLDLMKKVEDRIMLIRTTFDTVLEEITDGKQQPYLDYIFGEDKDHYLMLQDLVLGGKPGCTCSRGNGAASCPMSKYPPVFEVLCKVQSCDDSIKYQRSKQEEQILARYLAERSRHELYVMAGITVEDYCDILEQYY